MNSSDKDFIIAMLILISESSEEEEVEIKRRKRRKRRHNLFVNRNSEGCYENLINRHLIDNETEFKEYFHMSRYLFEKIISRIEPELKSAPSFRYPNPIEPKLKLCLLLRYLATGESMRSLAFQFRVSHQYISVIIKETLKAIKNHFLNEAIPEPATDMLRNNALKFYERWNYPNCVGVIDGRHVRVGYPSHTESGKQKDSLSIVLLAIVDTDYKYVTIDVGAYGKERDSSIFHHSLLGQKICRGKFNFPPPAILPGTEIEINHLVIGDYACTLHQNVMRTYPERQAQSDIKKRIYNYRHNRTRRITEYAFGLMCSYFRVFCAPIYAKQETTELIVVVSCILHNLMRDEKIPAPIELSFGEFENVTCPAALGCLAASRSRTTHYQAGSQVRQHLTNYFNGIGIIIGEDS